MGVTANADCTALPSLTELREMFHTLPPEEFQAAARRQIIGEWSRVNRFCGCCGAPMRHHERAEEMAMVCPKCGYIAYPKITPAIIVLVTKDDSILLQRNSHYHVPYWTLVAGFVDPGENFEDAVRREIREEASVEVADVRYFASQCWPFPSNMMVGFRAEYASGTLTPDGDEVMESAWFPRNALPDLLPRRNSIARRMIDDWVQELRYDE